MKPFFATCARGTEQALADELRALEIADVVPSRGGVTFGRHLRDGYMACLWSRIASRILLPLKTFEPRDAAGLYRAVHAIDWTAHLGPEQTLAVDVAGGHSPAGPPHFVALKTKDAVVDRIRAHAGTRPSVDTARPDVRINVHVTDKKATVNIDLAGRSLHRRGIDRAGSAAPLKENLAAAILRLAGWHDRLEQPFFDPFCGSGTLLIEAAWMALDIAPGLWRRRIGAESWRGHDAGLWAQLKREASQRRAAAADRSLRIAGCDASPAAIRTARDNLARAGLADRVRLEARPLRDIFAPWSEAGIVVTNPPYGERLGEAGELGPLYELLGDVLKRQFPGWHTWVLTGNPALGKRIGLRPASRGILYNGPIECRLLEIPIAAKPVDSEDGPGWRRPSDNATGFANKLRKNLRQLRPWARRAGLTCYRLYDTDMPQYNFAVDWYDGAVRVEAYEPPRKVDPEAADQRLRDAMQIVAEALEIDASDIVLRVRRRRSGNEPMQRREDRDELRDVREGDLRFLVNLTDYLDTGLFLDDRQLRWRIRKNASGGHFLNLFAYTCTASVAAAIGGASSTTSVDLSNVYLAWGRRNFAVNDLDPTGHDFIRRDVLQWLTQSKQQSHFDQIFVAPPSYSISKGMRHPFDIQSDHPGLLTRCARLLAPDGEILFATNLKSFVLEEDKLRGLVAADLTAEMTPRDFSQRPRLRVWALKKSHVDKNRGR